MKYKLYVLEGGSRNGERRELAFWQKIIYLQRKISTDEVKALDIDDQTAWKPPEDVYEMVDCEDGSRRMIYKHTVHYKPQDDGIQVKVEE